MDQPMRDFTDLLLRRGVVSLDQLSEATSMARQDDISVADALISCSTPRHRTCIEPWPTSTK